MENLTNEQKATNYETWIHIEMVMRLLARVQIELSKRMFTHDRSKLRSPEVEMFTKFTPILESSTYGSDAYKQTLSDMGPALQHHYAHNRHHPEFFQGGVEGMNIIDFVEMLCDWKAASMRHANGDINRSIEINAKRFDLDPQIVAIMKNSVPILEDLFSNHTTQKDI